MMNSAHTKPQTTEAYWFVARGSVLKGPYSNAELQEKIDRKEFTHWDYCWKQGYQEWRPIVVCQEFDRRGKIKELQPYPSAEVPGAVNEVHVKRPLRRLRPITVTKKDSRISISIYEWGLAAVLCVISSYVASTLTLSEMSSRFHSKVEMIYLGSTRQVGASQPKEISYAFSEPVFSSPGVTGLSDNFKIPVTYFGTLDRASATNSKFIVNNVMIESLHALPAFEKGINYDLDGVYTEPVQVYGAVSPQNPTVIKVHLPGSPAL